MRKIGAVVMTGGDARATIGPVDRVVESIAPSMDGSAFAFWGDHGRLPTVDGRPGVELRYRTEPPHGDFLYSLEIGNQVVSDEAGIRLFWGRNGVLSPCAGYLAITEYSKQALSYSV